MYNDRHHTDDPPPETDLREPEDWHDHPLTKPQARTIGVVGIGSEEAVGAQPPARTHYTGPAFGDCRDVLVAAPRQAYADVSPSYVCSDIFPAKLEAIREYAPGARSVFEIGAFYGHFLLTALEACPETLRTIWWSDNEIDAQHSNGYVHENLSWWAQRMPYDEKLSMSWGPFTYRVVNAIREHGFPIDLVHVDGAHGEKDALADIVWALSLQPKIVIVDDTDNAYHPGVRAAVAFVAEQCGLEVRWYATVNGFAVILP